LKDQTPPTKGKEVAQQLAILLGWEWERTGDEGYSASALTWMACALTQQLPERYLLRFTLNTDARHRFFSLSIS
jgi:hypothetical protein